MLKFLWIGGATVSVVVVVGGATVSVVGVSLLADWWCCCWCFCW